MTQSLTLPYGPTGYQVESVGPEGNVKAVLGLGPAGPTLPVILANTIVAGAAGTGRLADIPAAVLTALPTGTLAYVGNSSATVPSVHSYFRLLNPAPSAISSDTLQIFKPLGGASRIVWVRDETLNPYWISRLAGLVVVDPAGNDENFGNLASPLLTEAEAARRLGSSQVQTFVFKPGSFSDITGNVYSDWAQLVAAAALNAGPKTIIFDDSAGAVAIPVGAWDLGEGCQFVGVVPSVNSASANRVRITCPNGVTFAKPLFSIDNVELFYSGAGALMTVTGAPGRVFYILKNGRTNTTAAGGRIFDVAAGATFNAVLVDLGTIVVAGGGLFANVLAGATQFGVRVVESTSTAVRAPANCIAGPVGPTYVFTADELANFATAQAGMPGGVITLLFVYSAPNLSYVPVAGANWVDPDPTTIQNAIDRIAAVVSAGGATPIP